ncbi:hypothetical protein Tco_0739113 [Tanacetum coccineum]
MSTSKTYQQSLADASSETRPPMLEMGSYIPWASRFRRYINRKKENRKCLTKQLDEGPYQFQMFVPTGSTLPTLQTAEDLQGDELLHYDAEIKLMNLILLSIPNEIYNSFVAEPGEVHVSVYNRFAQLMNDLERNKIFFVQLSIVNTKFLNSLQPEWLKYVTQILLAKRLTVDSFDDLFDYLQQFEKLVNASRAKKLEKSHDPLALHTGSSSRNTSSYYVTHPTTVVDYDDEYQQDDVQTNSEDPLASAMLLLARAMTKNFSNKKIIVFVLHPTSETKQSFKEIGFFIKGFLIPTVNIQSRNPGNTERNTRRAYVQEEVFEGSNVQNETENVQSTLQTSTIGDDQIDSNIIFDEPNGNVNSGSVEKDTHVSNRYTLEQLARNAYQEDEKQQLFAQKVQQQNTTLSSQLELYKERVRVLENIKGDNNYLNEFLEDDRQAKHINQQAQS